MSAQKTPTLPGVPPPRLRAAYEALSAARKAAVFEHLTGNTSADYLADWFNRADAPVGATTIKQYRRKLKGV